MRHIYFAYLPHLIPRLLVEIISKSRSWSPKAWKRIDVEIHSKIGKNTSQIPGLDLMIYEISIIYKIERRCISVAHFDRVGIFLRIWGFPYFVWSLNILEQDPESWGIRLKRKWNWNQSFPSQMSQDLHTYVFQPFLQKEPFDRWSWIAFCYHLNGLDVLEDWCYSGGQLSTCSH